MSGNRGATRTPSGTCSCSAESAATSPRWSAWSTPRDPLPSGVYFLRRAAGFFRGAGRFFDTGFFALLAFLATLPTLPLRAAFFFGVVLIAGAVFFRGAAFAADAFLAAFFTAAFFTAGFFTAGFFAAGG